MGEMLLVAGSGGLGVKLITSVTVFFLPLCTYCVYVHVVGVMGVLRYVRSAQY